MSKRDEIEPTPGDKRYVRRDDILVGCPDISRRVSTCTDNGLYHPLQVSSEGGHAFLVVNPGNRRGLHPALKKTGGEGGSWDCRVRCRKIPRGV